MSTLWIVFTCVVVFIIAYALGVFFGQDEIERNFTLEPLSDDDDFMQIWKDFKSEEEQKMDEWFETDGVDILNGLIHAQKTQGKDFVYPHDREELDALIKDLKD